MDHGQAQLEARKLGTGAGAAASANERRRAALAEIDESPFSWFHAKACIVAGASGPERGATGADVPWRSLRCGSMWRHGSEASWKEQEGRSGRHPRRATAPHSHPSPHPRASPD